MDINEFKGTKRALYAHDFAGQYLIYDSPFYEGNDVLNYENIVSEEKTPITEEEATANAKLFCNAYQLLRALNMALARLTYLHGQTMNNIDNTTWINHIKQTIKNTL